MVVSSHPRNSAKGSFVSLPIHYMCGKLLVLCCWRQRGVALSQGSLSQRQGAPKPLILCRRQSFILQGKYFEWERLQSVLSHYELASGQRLNLEKTSIFFSKNTPLIARTQILQASGVQASNRFEKYLGLPALVGRSRRRAFMSVKDRIWCRISNWKNKLLSQAGKEILLKAVAQSIPTYTMSVFLLPKTLLQEINAMLQRYWWSHHEKEGSIHWIKWKKWALLRTKAAWVSGTLKALTRLC
ncbi:hypothetical protein SLA2020_281860 [Shorea laevis]